MRYAPCLPLAWDVLTLLSVVVQNAIVFNGAYGMHIIGAANLVYGAHTWNKNTGDGGTGIWMDCAGSGTLCVCLPQTAIDAVYRPLRCHRCAVPRL